MISSINSGIDYNTILSGASANSNSSKNSLSYSQQQSVDDILSNYDSDTLTQDDALSIIASLQDAGINPSKKLDDAMSSLGFDAEEIADLSGLSSSTDTDSIAVSGQVAAMSAFAVPTSSYLDNNTEEDDEESFNAVKTLLDTLFKDEDDEESDSIINTTSDYANKASNLNDDGKQELMDLFKKYNSEDSEYSSEEADTLVKTQLSDILSDSKNYNHSTFYA